PPHATPAPGNKVEVPNSTSTSGDGKPARVPRPRCLVGRSMPPLCWRDFLVQLALIIPGSRTKIEDIIQRAVPAVDSSRYDVLLGTRCVQCSCFASEKPGGKTSSSVDIYRRVLIQ